jgi:hypothetical protein
LVAENTAFRICKVWAVAARSGLLRTCYDNGRIGRVWLRDNRRRYSTDQVFSECGLHQSLKEASAVDAHSHPYLLERGDHRLLPISLIDRRQFLDIDCGRWNNRMAAGDMRCTGG